MESKELLVDYRGQIFDKVARVQEITGSFSEVTEVQEQVQKLTALAHEKLDEIKPQIMVYGIYNAGKSSIINELMREDRAEVDDRPMTDRVDYYPWNGYEIADTPGVGAPMAHEEVTQEHLKKADVVLFVMSTTGANERLQNYERMKAIADAGKKIIIVLNDKDGNLGADNDRVIPAIMQKVQDNMRSVGLEAAQYTIVPVNAKRAHKGRTENKSALYEKSNIAELEKNILFELRRTSPFMIMGNTVQEIERALEQLIRVMDAGDTDELGKIRRMLDTLRKRKSALRSHMQEYIGSKTSRLGRELPSLIWSHKDDADKECVNAEIVERIEKIASTVEEELEEELRNTFEDIAGDLTEVVEYTKKMQAELRTSLGVGDLSVQDTELLRTEENAAALDKLTATTNMLNAAELFLESNVGKGVAEAVAATVAKTTVGQAVLGMLPKVALPPVLGPVSIALTIISVIRALTKDNGKELMARAAQENEIKQKRAEMEARAQEDLQQKCIFAAEDIAEQLTQAVRTAIAEVFGKIEEGFHEALSLGEEKSVERTRVCAELNRLAGEFDVLRSELTHC